MYMTKKSLLSILNKVRPKKPNRKPLESGGFIFLFDFPCFLNYDAEHFRCPNGAEQGIP